MAVDEPRRIDIADVLAQGEVAVSLESGEILPFLLEILLADYSWRRCCPAVDYISEKQALFDVASDAYCSFSQVRDEIRKLSNPLFQSQERMSTHGS